MKLSEIVPWGRSFDEYALMFSLSGVDLPGRTLGCGDGPASFNAEATAAGHAVVSCDPIYALPAGAIRLRVEQTYEAIIGQVRRQPERHIWDRFHDPDDLGRHRLTAMGRFLDDFGRRRGSGRYLAAALPRLPFADGSFRLALVSHLLFLYGEGEGLGGATHVASALELMRVAGEVRIFPLLGLDGRLSPHIAPVRSALEAAGGRHGVGRRPQGDDPERVLRRAGHGSLDEEIDALGLRGDAAVLERVGPELDGIRPRHAGLLHHGLDLPGRAFDALRPPLVAVMGGDEALDLEPLGTQQGQGDGVLVVHLVGAVGVDDHPDRLARRQDRRHPAVLGGGQVRGEGHAEGQSQHDQ
ncbi:hypothetical protein [Tautonia plasticadhaerens]|uniref:SAM-dependent methyltransferase n=1 Tax=Tautonia plasticadhaerens TaxID=2527974 RepID=A0A518H402_9BACT|nr:hypothetical protein [Tautonia plasticadhaerens]QDV35537.1 hypothetical protein ElP_34400 [Tautonia plasticadhaerens]